MVFAADPLILLRLKHHELAENVTNASEFYGIQSYQILEVLSYRLITW